MKNTVLVIFSVCASVYVYNSLVFKCIPEYDYCYSRTILFIIISFNWILLMLAREYISKSPIKGLVAYVLPLGVYTNISYASLYKELCIVSLFVAVLSSTIFGASVLVKTRKNRFKKLLACILVCASISILISFVPVTLAQMIGTPMSSYNSSENKEEVKLEENLPVVSKAFAEWKTLDNDEKIEVLQIICDIECNFLGLSKLTVIADNLNENVLGMYDKNACTILININYLEQNDFTPEIWVKTIAHECYHAYQEALIKVYNAIGDDGKELYIFNDVPQMEEELKEYVSGTDDAVAYSKQLVEITANAYAETAWAEYECRIQDYWDSLDN